jgi:hypothetical protein
VSTEDQLIREAKRLCKNALVCLMKIDEFGNPYYVRGKLIHPLMSWSLEPYEKIVGYGIFSASKSLIKHEKFRRCFHNDIPTTLEINIGLLYFEYGDITMSFKKVFRYLESSTSNNWITCGF